MASFCIVLMYNGCMKCRAIPILLWSLKYCGQPTPRRQISGKDWDAGANILQSLNRAQVRCNTDINDFVVAESSPQKILSSNQRWASPALQQRVTSRTRRTAQCTTSARTAYPPETLASPTSSENNLPSPHHIHLLSQLEHVDQPVRLAVQRGLQVQQEPGLALPQGGDQPPGGATGDPIPLFKSIFIV